MTTPYTLDDPIVPTRSARLLLRLFENEGAQAAELLRGTQLERHDLEFERQRITVRQTVALIRNGLHACGDRPIGLGAGRHFSISDYGLLGYAMMSCADVAAAIRIASRYYRTAGSLFELGFELRHAELLIRIDDVFGIGDAWRFVAEQFFSSLRPLLLQLLGHHVDPLRVELNYAAPVRAEVYRDAFGCPIIWSAPACVFVFDAVVTRLPLQRANADVARLFEASCRELLARIRTDQGLSGQITRQLLARSGPPPSADEMAQVLNMGGRTLRRHLARQQTSYQQIVDEVRRRLAVDYLRSTSLSAQEIAELLGYTESTNFRRAFLKWMGQSPSEFRRAQRKPSERRPHRLAHRRPPGGDRR